MAWPAHNLSKSCRHSPDQGNFFCFTLTPFLSVSKPAKATSGFRKSDEECRGKSTSTDPVGYKRKKESLKVERGCIRGCPGSWGVCERDQDVIKICYIHVRSCQRIRFLKRVLPPESRPVLSLLPIVTVTQILGLRLKTESIGKIKAI